jgi:hypothetical protein
MLGMWIRKHRGRQRAEWRPLRAPAPGIPDIESDLVPLKKSRLRSLGLGTGQLLIESVAGEITIDSHTLADY